MIGNSTELIKWLIEQPQEKRFKCSEYKEKRNNDQNSRYWVLLNKLSLKTKIGIEELHFNMLKNYSPRYEVMIPAETEIRGIEYYELKSQINGLCEECKDQGIETLSPNEMEELKAMIRR